MACQNHRRLVPWTVLSRSPSSQTRIPWIKHRGQTIGCRGPPDHHFRIISHHMGLSILYLGFNPILYTQKNPASWPMACFVGSFASVTSLHRYSAPACTNHDARLPASFGEHTRLGSIDQHTSHKDPCIFLTTPGEAADHTDWLF